MDLSLARAALDFSSRRRRWLLGLAIAGAAGYGTYRAYHLPAVAEKRRKLARLLRALASVAAAASASAETVGIVSDDLNRFLRGDSDEVPASLRQLSKIAASDEFAGPVARVSEALTTGVLRGVAAAEPGSGGKPESEGEPTLPERLLDKLFSTAGSGFASVVVGSFARNLVMGFYAAQGESARGAAGSDSEAPPVPEWVHLICSDKVRRLIGDSIQLFVSTAVAVYVDKTMDLNTFDEMFSGITNPKHDAKVKDLLVSVCNGAVETLVKTSHQVLSTPGGPGPNSASSTDREEDMEVEAVPSPTMLITRSPFTADVKDGGGGWVDQVSSTLALPSNRSFLLDLTGRVTSETVRSFLDFALWNLLHGTKKGAKAVHGEIAERGMEVVRYVSAKAMVLITVCIALCLHLLSGTRVMVPASSF